MEKDNKEKHLLATIDDIVKVDFSFLKGQVYDHIRLRSRKQNSNTQIENKLSNNFIDTYILFLVYQFYKDRNNFAAKDSKYQEDFVVLEISPGNDEYSKIKITSGMMLFYEEFTASRLFNIKKSTLDELRDLKDKDSKSELDLQRYKSLKKEVFNSISRAKGLKDILIRSNNRTNNFRGLLYNSMAQFYEKIPSDNEVLDNEWRKIRNLIRNKPENSSTKKAFLNAFKQEGVSFIYKKEEGQPGIFYAVKIDSNYDDPELDVQDNIYDSLDLVKQNLPKFDETIKEFDYQNWNPYNYKKYARILKIIFRQNEGVPVSMYELKVIVSDLLINAKKIDPKRKETSVKDSTLDLLSENPDPFDIVSELDTHEELKIIFITIDNYLSYIFEAVDLDLFNEIFVRYEEMLHENYDEIEKVELFINYYRENEDKNKEEILFKLSKIYSYIPKLNIVDSPLDILIFTQLKLMKVIKNNE
tara:strand:+ start:903 stop:2318 length:1416 start_codon:yes stop_codon:yes gene_type:complete